jgi:hypothetical protein
MLRVDFVFERSQYEVKVVESSRKLGLDGLSGRRRPLTVITLRPLDKSKASQLDDRLLHHLRGLAEDGEGLAKLTNGERAAAELGQVHSVQRLQAMGVCPLRTLTVQPVPTPIRRAV